MCVAFAAGMWRDGVLQQQNSSSDSADSKAGGSSSSTYTLMQNPGIFASNFIPLWAGVAQGGLVQGGRVVEALQNSGLVQPAGVCLLGRGGSAFDKGGVIRTNCCRAA
jgi:hypothetical protein